MYSSRVMLYFLFSSFTFLLFLILGFLEYFLAAAFFLSCFSSLPIVFSLHTGGGIAAGSLNYEAVNLQGDQRGVKDLAMVLNMPCQVPGCTTRLADKTFFVKPDTCREAEGTFHPIMLRRQQNIPQVCLHICKSCYKSRVRIDVTSEMKHYVKGNDASSACVQHAVAFLRKRASSEDLLADISKPVFGRGHSRSTDLSDDAEVRLTNVLEKSEKSNTAMGKFVKRFTLEPFGITYTCEAVPNDPTIPLAALTTAVGYKSGKVLTSKIHMRILSPSKEVLGVMRYKGNHNQAYAARSKRNHNDLVALHKRTEGERAHKIARRSNSTTVASHIASVCGPRYGKFGVDSVEVVVRRGDNMSVSQMLGDHWEISVALAAAFGDYVERVYHDSVDLNALINNMTPRQIVVKFFPTTKFLDELCKACPCLDEDYENAGSVEVRRGLVRDAQWKARRVRGHFTGEGVDVKRRAQLVKGIFRKL